MVLSDNFQFTNAEKIFMFLLGKYFAYHSGITKETTVSLSDISDGIGVVVTTLSAPLRRLVSNHTVEKPEKDTYRINPHKIESNLQEIRRRYGVSEETVKSKETTSNPFKSTFGNPIPFEDLFGKKMNEGKDEA